MTSLRIICILVGTLPLLLPVHRALSEDGKTKQSSLMISERDDGFLGCKGGKYCLALSRDGTRTVSATPTGADIEIDWKRSTSLSPEFLAGAGMREIVGSGATPVTTKPRFAIHMPIEDKNKNVDTTTRAEVMAVEGSGGIAVAFSSDCGRCNVEVTDKIALLWASGAEHLYAGKVVPIDHKAELRAQKVRVGNGGRIFIVAKSGTIFSDNRLHGWTFVPLGDKPLIFKVVKDKGYVHVGGRGTAKGPDGKVYQLN